jgi:hypothetical protein
MPKLLIDVEARFAQFQDSLNKIEKSGAQTAARLGSAFSVASKAFAAIGAAAAIGGITSGFLRASEELDAFNDAADATGASVEILSGLDEVARRTGATLGDVSGAIVKLNQALSQKAGSEQEKALQAIGLSADELRRKDPGQALQDVAIALTSIPNSGERARLAFELFGRSAGDIIPLLQDINDAGELNVTVTGKQAEEAAKFQKAMSRLSADITTAGRAIGIVLLPAINDLISNFRIAAQSGQDFFTTIGRALGISTLDEALDENVKSITRVNEQLIKLQSGQGGSNSTFNSRRIEALKREREELQAESRILEREAEARRRLRQTENAGSPGRTFTPPVPDDTAGGAAAAKREADRIADLRMLAAEQLLGIDDASQKLTASIEQAYDAFDARRKKSADAASEATVDSLTRLDDLVGKYKDLADPTRAYARELEVVTALEIKQYLTAEEAFNARLRLIEQETSALNGQNDKLKDSSTFARDFGLTMSSSFEAAITGAKGFGEALQGLSRDLAQIITRNLITEPLGTAASDFVKSFKFGDVVKNLFGGGRAAGGPVRAGRLYEVNEEDGPGELLTAGGRTYLMANQNGVVTPTRASGGRQSGEGGTTVVVYQTNTFSGGADRATLSAWAAQIRAETEQGVLASLNRNGAFARATGRSS